MLNKPVKVTSSSTKNSTEKTVKKHCRYNSLVSQFKNWKSLKLAKENDCLEFTIRHPYAWKPGMVLGKKINVWKSEILEEFLGSASLESSKQSEECAISCKGFLKFICTFPLL